MKRKNSIGSIKIFIIISLFAGLIFAPSITADISTQKLVEVNTEIFGFDNFHQNTIILSESEISEIEKLIVNVEKKLANIKTREECNIILEDAYESFCEYGLISTDTSNYIVNMLKKVDSLYNNFLDRFEKYINDRVNSSFLNLLCLLSGTFPGEGQYNGLGWIWYLSFGLPSIFYRYSPILFILSLIIFWPIAFISGLINAILYCIPFGLMMSYNVENNVEQFFSIGLKGVVSGQIYIKNIFGFIGIKIGYVSSDFERVHIFGSALAIN
jgi:hypothetical protein